MKRRGSPHADLVPCTPFDEDYRYREDEGLRHSRADGRKHAADATPGKVVPLAEPFHSVREELATGEDYREAECELYEIHFEKRPHRLCMKNFHHSPNAIWEVYDAPRCDDGQPFGRFISSEILFAGTVYG
jgi:hypothetical protein